MKGLSNWRLGHGNTCQAGTQRDQPPQGLSLLHTLRVHSDVVLRVEWSGDGATLASTSVDRTIGLWDGAKGELRRRLEGHHQGVNQVAFAPDQNWMASCSYDRSIRVEPRYGADHSRAERTQRRRVGYRAITEWVTVGVCLSRRDDSPVAHGYMGDVPGVGLAQVECLPRGVVSRWAMVGLVLQRQPDDRLGQHDLGTSSGDGSGAVPIGPPPWRGRVTAARWSYRPGVKPSTCSWSPTTTP